MSKIYRSFIAIADKAVPKALRPLWEHPAGPKTIFFWAPAFKWGLVIAGLSDMTRPAEKLSVFQCGSLAATGLVWSRYSLALVLISLDAYKRPLDKVSTSQSATLAATGLIWTRYCLVITPINYSLAVCNFMLGVANAVQWGRAYKFQSAMKSGVDVKKELEA